MALSRILASSMIGEIPDANAPSGSVIQVIQATTSAAQVFNVGGNSSTTFYDIAGLSLSITPRDLNSKIYLVGSINAGQFGNGYTAYFRFTRDGVAVGSSNSLGNGKEAHSGFRSGNEYQHNNISMNFLDSPISSSAINYKVQICNTGGASYPSYINRPHSPDTTWMFGTMTVLTAMEIAA